MARSSDERQYLPFAAYQPAFGIIALACGIALAVSTGPRIYSLVMSLVSSEQSPPTPAPAPTGPEQKPPASAR